MRRPDMRVLVMALMIPAVVGITGGAMHGSPRAPTLGGGPAGAPTTAADGEKFYVPPDPLRKARPGTLIRSAPLPGAPSGAQAWLVLYHSRAADGSDTAVSGIVVAPLDPAPDAPRPVVSVGIGTAGLADECATSRAPGALLGSPLVRSMIDAGRVLVVTDYQGLGTPGLHPYGSGESSARNVIDAARAAREIPETSAGSRVLFGGHSQGAHAALFAAALVPEYAPELTLVGVFGVAPSIDLVTLVSTASKTPGSIGYAVMFVRGLEAAYPKARRHMVLTDEARAASAVVEEACVDGVLAAFADRTTADVFIRDPAEVRVWRRVLARNSLEPGTVDAPILLVKGDADDVLPKALTDAYADASCAAGDDLTYRVYQGATHQSVLAVSGADVERWLADRVAGVPTTSTC